MRELDQRLHAHYDRYKEPFWPDWHVKPRVYGDVSYAGLEVYDTDHRSETDSKPDEEVAESSEMEVDSIFDVADGMKLEPLLDLYFGTPGIESTLAHFYLSTLQRYCAAAIYLFVTVPSDHITELDDHTSIYYSYTFIECWRCAYEALE